MSDSKAQLIARINTRKRHDWKWGCANIWFTQTLIILAVVSSFASTLAVMSGMVAKLIAAALAGLPGVLFTLDRSFNFMRQSRWHYCLVAELDALLNKLERELARAAS